MARRSSRRFGQALALVVVMIGIGSVAEARPRPHRAARFTANKTFGLGLILGSPTGLSGKYFLGADTALDFGLGVYGGYRYDNAVHAHVDFLWHPVNLASTPAFHLPLYFGLGGRLLDHDRGKDDRNHTHLGVRVPIGIALDFNRVPFDIFFELALVADVLVEDDHGRLDFDGAVGFRYWF